MEGDLALADRHNADVAGAAEDIHDDVPTMTLQKQIDGALAEAEIANADVVDGGRQQRPLEPDLVMQAVRRQTEACLQQHQRRSACPRLRGAGHGIKGRAAAGAPWETAEQFRQTHFHIAQRVELAAKNLQHVVLQSIMSESERYQ